MAQKILGIDPGSHNFGIGCIKKNGQKIELLFAEVITAPRKEDLYPRLAVIQERLHVLLDKWKPDVAVIEDLFHARNARSAFRLGMARGVAVAACLERKIRIYEYAPAKIKSVVTGYGRADKEQVRRMTELQVGQKIDERHDATDAVATALCHIFSPKLELNQ